MRRKHAAHHERQGESDEGVRFTAPCGDRMARDGTGPDACIVIIAASATAPPRRAREG